MNHLRDCLLSNGFPGTLNDRDDEQYWRQLSALPASAHQDEKQLILEVVRNNRHIVEQLLVSIAISFHLGISLETLFLYHHLNLSFLF